MNIKAHHFLLMMSVAALTFTHIKAISDNKRQGIFGLCQGWGAGCGMDYRSNPGKLRLRANSRGGLQLGDFPRVPGSNFPFTSGGSWKPIGKRTAWFTDIPYLRNPLISYPRFRKPPGFQDYSRRYPLAYKSTFASRSSDILNE